MNAAAFTEADGRRLAVDMLVEMRELGMDELAIEGAEYRSGRPQSDVLVRYLRNAQRHAAIEAGFLAVLTDALGCANGGALELYERHDGAAG